MHHHRFLIELQRRRSARAQAQTSVHFKKTNSGGWGGEIVRGGARKIRCITDLCTTRTGQILLRYRPE